MFVPSPRAKVPETITKTTAVARCKEWRTENDCKFFLAEADDAKARLEKSLDIRDAPKTPASRRTGDAMLTPNTGSSSKMNLFGSRTRRDCVQGMNDSPTMRRFRIMDGDDDDLASHVIALLKQDGGALKSSTESAVRHTIGDRIAQYEAALQNSEKSLNFALQKLGELESDTGT